jgi:alpha-tubulin suppressor-like RCC1 family protein
MLSAQLTQVLLLPKNDKEHTEVYSWGSDAQGQLGLGATSEATAIQVPRSCSYKVPILKVACGREHTVILTTSQLVYAMGSNR